MAQSNLAALAAKMGGGSSPTGINFSALAQQNGGTSTAPTSNNGATANPFGTSTVPDPSFQATPQTNSDGTLTNPFSSAATGSTQAGDKGFMQNVFGNGNGNLGETILKNTIGSNGIGGLVARPIVSAMTAGATKTTADAAMQASQVTNKLLQYANSLPATDPHKSALISIAQSNQPAQDIATNVENKLGAAQETQEQNAGIAANAASTLAMGASTPATMLGKMGLNAAIGGLSGVGQAAANNGSVQDVIAQGTFGAATGAIISGAASLGEKALSTIPTRLYSQFFKTTTDEFAKGMTSDAAAILQKSDPTTFQRLVDSGVVKLNEDGTIQVSKSTAQKALEAGIAGSPKSMGAQVAAQTMSIETKVQDAATKAPPVSIGTLERDSTINLLQTFRDAISKANGGVFANDLTDPIDSAIKVLQNSKDGTIPAQDALQIRRMLDAMQKSKAYVQDSNLTINDSILKNATNYFRQQVNSIPEMKPLMNQYSSYMDMLTDLQKRGAQLQNTKAFNLFDLMAITEGGSVFGGGNMGVGTLIDAGLRTVTSATGGTHIAQVLNGVNNAVQSPLGQTASTVAQRGVALTIPKVLNPLGPPTSN